MKMLKEQMQEIRCDDGSIRRVGGIGPENEVRLVKVFLGMEFGRYDGCEWGYVFGDNPDGSVAVVVPMNGDNSAYAEIYTACVWNDRFNAYYADGGCVHIMNGELSWFSRKEAK